VSRDRILFPRVYRRSRSRPTAFKSRFRYEEAQFVPQHHNGQKICERPLPDGKCANQDRTETGYECKGYYAGA
jgi:hypothetical protein